MSHESEVGRIRPWAAAERQREVSFWIDRWTRDDDSRRREGGALSLPPPRKARLVRHARPSVVSAAAERGPGPIVVIVACDRSRLVRRVARRRSSCSPHSVASSAHRHLRAIAVPPCAPRSNRSIGRARSSSSWVRTTPRPPPAPSSRAATKKKEAPTTRPRRPPRRGAASPRRTPPRRRPPRPPPLLFTTPSGSTRWARTDGCARASDVPPTRSALRLI